MVNNIHERGPTSGLDFRYGPMAAPLSAIFPADGYCWVCVSQSFHLVSHVVRIISKYDLLSQGVPGPPSKEGNAVAGCGLMVEGGVHVSRPFSDTSPSCTVTHSWTSSTSHCRDVQSWCTVVQRCWRSCDLKHKKNMYTPEKMDRSRRSMTSWKHVTETLRPY